MPVATFLPGGSEWIIIFVAVLILFGGAKIPELMRGIGRGVGELKSGLEDSKRKLNEALAETDDSIKS